MKAEFLLERQGQIFARYCGLLDAAHEAGLTSIETTLLQYPSAENQHTAICQAKVTLHEAGHQRVFTGIGDANPNNVNRAMTGCVIRLAETRAKARALRDAINFAGAAVEELGDEDASEVSSPPLHSATRTKSAVPATNAKRPINDSNGPCVACQAPPGKMHGTRCEFARAR